jgi:precorrin-6B methylase 2
VDVGGGTGAMLAELLHLHPDLHGILVDQARTTAKASEQFQAAGVSDRVITVGQSFFDALPSGADLYLLRGVINDWPDREALAILKRCAEAAAPDGRVVVLKGVTTDDEPKDLTIEMILAGGKPRTLTEFGELARQAGLQVDAAGPQPNGYFVTECHPG